MFIQEDYFKNIFNTVREAILVLDENMRVLSANRSFFTIFKVEAADTIGSLLYDLGNGQWNIPYLRVLLEDVLPKNDTVDDYKIEHTFESIGQKTMLLNACKIREKKNDLPIILLAIEDITERTRLEDLLTDSEKRYRRVFETASDSIVLLEKRDGTIIQANPATEKMLGYSEKECVGKNLQDIGVSLDMSDFAAIMQALNKKSILNYDDVPVKTRYGQDINADIYMVDRAKLAQCNIRDVTERKHKEENIQKLNRILVARSNSSKALISASDESWYLNEVCRIIVEDCGHALVWIGFAEQDEGRTVRPVAHAGFEEGYLDVLNITWMDTERGRGPVGTAIRTGKPSVIHDIHGNPAFAPWRDEAVKRGYASIIGVPLLAEGKAFGSLNIYSRQQDPFSKDEVQLLTDLAADLSYGIATIRSRAAQAEAGKALIESEERFRLAIQATKDGIWEWNILTNQVFFSPRLCEIIGYSVDDPEFPHSYKAWAERIHPDDYERVQKAMTDHLEKRTKYDIDYRHRHKSGEYRWQNSTGEAIFDESGKFTKMVGCISDITERKKAEETLYIKEHQLTEAQRIGQIGNWDWDSTTDTIIWSDEYYHIFGIDPKLPAPNYHEHLKAYTAESGARLDAVVKKAMQTGEAYELDLEFADPGKRTRWIRARGEVKKDANGRIVGLRGTAQDITERKKAEDRLVVLNQAIEALPVGVTISDLEGKILYINPFDAETHGYVIDELIGKNARIFAPEEYSRPINIAVLSSMKVWKRETVNIKKSGAIFPVYLISLSVRTSDGKPIGIVTVCEDLTERQKLEEQLRQSQKMEAVGTLAGGVAHDFNNILNVIMGYGTMVMDKLEAGSPSKEQMNEVLSAADRAANLTRRLLVFSRKQAVEVKPININELILGLQKMLVRIISESIDFNLDLADRPLIVLADAGQIEQVLMNLAANAKDAMQEGGRLTIGTKLEEVDDEYVAAYGYGKTGRYVLITVADTGHGIDVGTQRKIFEPFFTTKGIGEGTGLGLAISYGIIKQHSGYIKVYSEPGQGTVFKIYLPLAEETASLHKKTEIAVPVKGGNETILVAEDDAALRNLARIVLESFGYTVISAEDGEDAIAKFMENRDRINLALLDMIMPKKNGKEVSEAIRKVNPRIKVLFVSGYTMDIIKSKELTEAGFDFIHKPFPPQTLLINVREVLDR